MVGPPPHRHPTQSYPFWHTGGIAKIIRQAGGFSMGDLEVKVKKKWTLDRVQKKLVKSGLSVTGDKLTDVSFDEILILKTAFKNTVSIGFTADEDGDLVAAGLGFNYGPAPKAEAGWYPIKPDAREHAAMTKFAKIIGKVPVYWRVVVAERTGV